MNYKYHYDKLINRSRNNKFSPGEYFEEHHIIPRCIGGSNDSDNLVKLTAREHYIAHQLLVKIHPENYKILFAAIMMTVVSNNNKYRASKNKLYEWLRIRQSTYMKTKIGSKNSSYNTKWIYNLDLKINKKIDISDVNQYLLNGWKLGRKIIWNNQKCKICQNLFNAGSRNQKYCSKECRYSKRQNSFKNREDELLQAYKKYGSINKAVKSLGFPGAMGSWFSQAKKILKVR